MKNLIIEICRTFVSNIIVRKDFEVKLNEIEKQINMNNQDSNKNNNNEMANESERNDRVTYAETTNTEEVKRKEKNRKNPTLSAEDFSSQYSYYWEYSKAYKNRKLERRNNDEYLNRTSVINARKK